MSYIDRSTNKLQKGAEKKGMRTSADGAFLAGLQVAEDHASYPVAERAFQEESAGARLDRGPFPERAAYREEVLTSSLGHQAIQGRAALAESSLKALDHQHLALVLEVQASRPAKEQLQQECRDRPHAPHLVRACFR